MTQKRILRFPSLGSSKADHEEGPLGLVTHQLTETGTVCCLPSLFPSLYLLRLLRSLQGDVLAGDGFLLGLLKLGEVLSICLVGEWLREMERHEVLYGDDDLLLQGDIELLKLSG